MKRKIIWSPVELEYLKNNRHNSVNQLTVALAKSRNAVSKMLKHLESGGDITQLPKPVKGKSKIGKRKDCDNMFFRSAWEANVYRLLVRDKSIRLVEYEPHVFTFTSFGIYKGTVSYCPDFKITYHDGSYNWIEVKGGFMKPSDKTKIRRFKKYFPEEFAKLVAVTPGPKSKTVIFFVEQDVAIKWYYPELNKKYKNLIPHWE